MQTRLRQPDSMSVSCIICAFNEERTIAGVLNALRRVTRVSEVIVVDDGSTDRTCEVVGGYSDVRLVSLPRNAGKTLALATGIEHSTGEYILTLDADLVGLTAGAIDALLDPVLDGRTSVTLSLRANSLALYRALGLDFVSGERVFPAGLLKANLQRMRALPRWGAEVFMNTLVTDNELSIAVVRWPTVSNTRKGDKVGAVSGLLAELAMTFDIFEVLSPITVVTQNVEMRRLSRSSTIRSAKPQTAKAHSHPLPV